MNSRKSFVLLAAGGLAVGLTSGGCGHGAVAPAQAPAAARDADNGDQVAKWLAREVPAVGTKHVSLFDGKVQGDIESLTDPKPDCADSEGTVTCSIEADLGKDGGGEHLPSTVVCSVSTSVAAFGPVLEATSLQNQSLDETPTLQVAPVGEGVAATFMANTSEVQDDKSLVGTAKFAALYAHGYMATCYDSRAGGRKTFERVAAGFFSTLKLESTITLFAFGYKTRVGDRPSGLRYAAIAKKSDDGFIETSTQFHLETDGKTWSIKDALTLTERNAKGGVEKMQTLFWVDGKGPAVLSAKPSEDKRFRLKFEVGDKSNGLESTPKAPLNTELWAASELLKVSTGASRRYRYAFLDLVDSDPAFHYLTITRAAPGVLSEAQDASSSDASRATNGGDDASPDELSIDEHGLVTKQVSPQLVSERMYTWGSLPTAVGKSKGTGATKKKSGS